VDNRRLTTGQVSLIGLALGVACYLVAEWFTPKNVGSPGEHDVLLAIRLGLIYVPMVGLCVGWLQNSWRRAAVGAAVGVLIGVLYWVLSVSGNFLAIMVGFPCLLGGLFAALVGSNRDEWVKGLGRRFGKGLLAGLVLGFVYMLVLNVVAGMLAQPYTSPADYTDGYIRTMWRAGPVALGLASALFVVLLRWAIGLSRVRLVVFEDA